MKFSKYVLIGCVAAGLAGVQASAGTLIGSFHVPTNQDPVNQQNVSLVTRTSDGNSDTRGAVAGTVTAVSDVLIGIGSYPGLDVATFSGVTQYRDVNRYGDASNPGVVVFDYDLSTYLASNPELTVFTIDANYSNRRASSGGERAGDFYISVNGNGLALDTTVFNTVGTGGSIASSPANYDLVNTIPASTLSGSFSVDISDYVNGSTDGKVRIAYVDTSFYARIDFSDASGIVGDVPEPSSLALLGLGGLLMARRRR